MREEMTVNAEDTFIAVADHPALNIVNTVPLVDGVLVDALQSDADVLRWLARFGWVSDEGTGKLKGSLLTSARALREVIRGLVERRKAGKRVDVSELNGFLAAAESYLVLEMGKSGTLTARRAWRQRTAEEMLAPLAEAAAELLTAVDFELVRRCESDECVLWFFDRTKSHRRRWCSMATCGNRHKVAAFRQRQAR